jgi:putative transposase
LRQAEAGTPLKGRAPVAPNQRWSMDFVHDSLIDGRSFRVLTLADTCTRSRVILTEFR